MTVANVSQLPKHILQGFKIDPSTGCWLWQRSLDRDGYGWSSLHNKTHQAHRLVYRLLVNEPPAGATLDHLCRVRHCVNPDHLEPVSNRENLLRSELTPAGMKCCAKCGGEFDVLPSGQRRCRPCYRAWKRQYERDRRSGLLRRSG